MRGLILSARICNTLMVCWLAAGLSGCATSQRAAVPLQLADKVEVAGLGRVRVWGDAEIPNVARFAAVRRKQIAEKRPALLKRRRVTMNYLALSGGGSDGAFGAGFLNGWTAAGTRPEFEVVSGVSTGALMAPFAFLGPAYDAKLKELYTKYRTKDIITPKVLAGLVGGNAVTSSAPLERLIAKYMDRKFVAAVAREHRKGRRLIVGTTNLDAERPVVWDMGRIASRGTSKALALFRRVLLASASIPGIFPPIYIAVTSGGKTYKEMHVDGGTTNNTFLLPLHLDLQKMDRRNRVRWNRRLFVIVNSKTLPSPETVKNSTLSIAGRSIATLIKQQTEGDVLKLYLRAKKNRIAFRLASVPVSFNVKNKEPFDRRYMQALYALGYKLAKNKYKWKRRPDGL